MFTHCLRRHEKSTCEKLVSAWFSMWTSLGLNQGPPDYEYRKVIFCDISLLWKHTDNQWFTKNAIFFEYQKIPLTETKCLRIVYAELEHQTINSAPYTLCCLCRIWSLMNGISNRLQSVGFKWPDEIVPHYRILICQMTKRNYVKWPNKIVLDFRKIQIFIL